MSIPGLIKEVYARSSCLFTAQEVESALDRMAMEIRKKLEDKNPVVICVMVGGMVPLGHLLLRLDFPLELDYVHATRYNGEIAGGELIWKVKPSVNLKGRTVLIVDDILDGGITLAAIIKEIGLSEPESIHTAVLVDKHHKRIDDGLQKADFVGLEVDDRYVFGYGMDYKAYLRNAPGIYVVHPDHE